MTRSDMSERSEGTERVSGGAAERGRARFMLADNETNFRRMLRMVLEGEGYEVDEADGVVAAENRLAGGPPVDVVLLDVKLGDDSGIGLLRRLKARSLGDDAPATRFDPDVPVIMISGHASIEDAVKATKMGAFDFLDNP